MVNAPSFEITWPPDLKFLRNHNPVMPAKLNHLRFDGELHNPAGFAVAADVVYARDEFTKRPGSFRGISFHYLKYKPGNHADVMGYSPHRNKDGLLVFLQF
jgi:hypothetical protein